MCQEEAFLTKAAFEHSLQKRALKTTLRSYPKAQSSKHDLDSITVLSYFLLLTNNLRLPQ